MRKHLIATLALACTVQILFSWKYKLVLECMPFYARTLDVPPLLIAIIFY